MSGWREEYIAGIRDAEKHNPANLELVDACSQLADRVAALEAEKAALLLQLQQQQQQPDKHSAGSSPDNNLTSTSGNSNSNEPESHLITKLRATLSEALRQKGTFSARLQTAEDELARLKTKQTTDTKTLRDLSRENKTLQIKLRDREEELRAKNKLVADVQDELAVLNLQLNVVEKRRKEKEEENKQLIERFMRRVGQEAEAMNLANEPLFNNSTRRGDNTRRGDRAR